MRIDQLVEKAKSFILPEGEAELREAALAEFLRKFPRTKLESLTLEEYAIGNDDSFCYWLEFKNVLFGIGGGNSSKFGIYRGKDSKYYTGFGNGRQEYSGIELEKYYVTLRDKIVKALEYVERDEIQRIAELNIPLWNMVLQKILAVYYPNKFLRIGAPRVLVKCAQFLELDECELTKDNSILISYLIQKNQKQHDYFKNWHEEKYSVFLWQLFKPENSDRSYYIIGSKYGENSDIDIYDQLVEKSVVAVGFANHLDLTEYYGLPHKQIISYLESEGESRKSYNALKHFLSLKPGDWIAIKKSGSPKGKQGFLSVVGIVEVVEKDGQVYEHDEDLGHTVQVKFLKVPVYKEFELGGYGRTIHKISQPDRIKQIFEADYIETEIEQGIPIAPNLSLNTIIYGPPGTGKTYKLKNELFELFTDEHSTQTKSDFYEELVKDLFWWEVIAIALIEMKSAKVYQIFEHPLIQAKNSISQNKTPKNTIWRWLMGHAKDDCPNVNIKNRDIPQLFWKDDQSVWSIDEEVAKAETPDFYDVLQKYKSFVPQKQKDIRYVFTTFHQSFSYEDFIEGIKPLIAKNEKEDVPQEITYHIEDGVFKTIVNRAVKNPSMNYAIFIDEINRGNIASIFGELITLIEEDKRIDCSNEIFALLPYSKQKFGVPKNLYIIGTMNTADRSVEALDTALRRRFSFIELNPDPRLLSNESYRCDSLDLERLLSTVNNRIEKLLDKDYCIGHAYFMNIKDRKKPLNELRQIFSNRILPLLQEYFYGDWGKIQLVLGDGFIAKHDNSVEFKNTDDYIEYDEFEQKPIYRFTSSESWSIETFKSIYEK